MLKEVKMVFNKHYVLIMCAISIFVDIFHLIRYIRIQKIGSDKTLLDHLDTLNKIEERMEEIHHRH